jgi:hypothetical protein
VFCVDGRDLALQVLDHAEHFLQRELLLWRPAVVHLVDLVGEPVEPVR